MTAELEILAEMATAVLRTRRPDLIPAVCKVITAAGERPMPDGPITPTKFYSLMRDLAAKHQGDPEAFGSTAVKLMCQTLRQHGYEQGVSVFYCKEHY